MKHSDFKLPMKVVYTGEDFPGNCLVTGKEYTVYWSKGSGYSVVCKACNKHIIDCDFTAACFEPIKESDQ